MLTDLVFCRYPQLLWVQESLRPVMCSTALPLTLAISSSPLWAWTLNLRKEMWFKKNPVCAWVYTDTYSLHFEQLCFFITHHSVHKDSSKSESYRKRWVQTWILGQFDTICPFSKIIVGTISAPTTDFLTDSQYQALWLSDRDFQKSHRNTSTTWQTFNLEPSSSQCSFFYQVPWTPQRLPPLYLFSVCTSSSSFVVSIFHPAVRGLLQFTFYTSDSYFSERSFCFFTFVDSALPART